MRVSAVTILLAAVGVAVIVTVAGALFIDPNAPLLADARLSMETITPNADRDTDVVNINYALSRNALVTISFTNSEGETFYFRDGERRSAGDLSVQFSGVVQGYTLPDESFDGTVESRLLPDGDYTWRIAAEGVDREEQQEITGALTVREGDPALPLIDTVSITPTTFSPNQDGVDDRVAISFVLNKEAEITAYLLGEQGMRYYIPRRVTGTVDQGDAARQEFDYDGGVTAGGDPPADGTYLMYIEAQDLEGQRYVIESEITIENGGKPRAEITNQSVGYDVNFSTFPYEARYFSTEEALGDLIPKPETSEDNFLGTVNVPLGDLLVFKLTVWNFGGSPIRTDGAEPGTVYQQDQNMASLGEIRSNGAWYVAIQCDTTQVNYPYRWAIGERENLMIETDPVTGKEYRYLPAGETSEVWGAVRLTEVNRELNPQNCWAALIHEGVAVPNPFVGARSVYIDAPAEAVAEQTEG